MKSQSLQSDLSLLLSYLTRIGDFEWGFLASYFTIFLNGLSMIYFYRLGRNGSREDKPFVQNLLSGLVPELEINLGILPIVFIPHLFFAGLNPVLTNFAGFL